MRYWPVLALGLLLPSTSACTGDDKNTQGIQGTANPGKSGTTAPATTNSGSTDPKTGDGSAPPPDPKLNAAKARALEAPGYRNTPIDKTFVLSTVKKVEASSNKIYEDYKAILFEEIKSVNNNITLANIGAERIKSFEQETDKLLDMLYSSGEDSIEIAKKSPKFLTAYSRVKSSINNREEELIFNQIFYLRMATRNLDAFARGSINYFDIQRLQAETYSHFRKGAVFYTVARAARDIYNNVARPARLEAFRAAYRDDVKDVASLSNNDFREIVTDDFNRTMKLFREKCFADIKDEDLRSKLHALVFNTAARDYSGIPKNLVQRVIDAQSSYGKVRRAFHMLNGSGAFGVNYSNFWHGTGYGHRPEIKVYDPILLQWGKRLDRYVNAELTTLNTFPGDDPGLLTPRIEFFNSKFKTEFTKDTSEEEIREHFVSLGIERVAKAAAKFKEGKSAGIAKLVDNFVKNPNANIVIDGAIDTEAERILVNLSAMNVAVNDWAQGMSGFQPLAKVSNEMGAIQKVKNVKRNVAKNGLDTAVINPVVDGFIAELEALAKVLKR